MTSSSDMRSDQTPPQWGADEHASLVRIAERILGNRHDAEDVVQETLLAVWRLSKKAQIENKERYVRHAVRMNALKHRVRSRRFAGLDDASEAESAQADAEGGEDPEGRGPFDVSPFELEMALAELPAAQQVVIRMRYYMDLSFREIGEALSVPENTAASRARYALAALRRWFQK